MVEVKQVGRGKGADRQLLVYVFYKGGPMAVLTDGQEWHFFLPTEQGDYGERRVYKLDLLEHDPREIEAGLGRYLGYGEVRSGRTIEAARGTTATTHDRWCGRLTDGVQQLRDSSRRKVIQSDNTLKVHFSATLGEEPEVKAALGQQLGAQDSGK